MTHYDVKRLALVLAVQAEIEGMKIENIIREHKEQSPAYGEEQFNSCASRLENLAYAHDDEL
jgi:hypothetical protein